MPAVPHFLQGQPSTSHEGDVESGQLLPQPAVLRSLLSADENHGGNIHAAVLLQTRDSEADTLQVVLEAKVAAREHDQALVARRNPK